MNFTENEIETLRHALAMLRTSQHAARREARDNERLGELTRIRALIDRSLELDYKLASMVTFTPTGSVR